VNNHGGAVADGHDFDKTQGVFRARRFMLERDVAGVASRSRSSA